MIGLPLGVVIVFVYFVLFASLWEASDAPTWSYFWALWVDSFTGLPGLRRGRAASRSQFTATS